MTRTPFGLDHATRFRFVREAGLLPDGRCYYTETAIDGEHETDVLHVSNLDGSDARRIADLDDVRAVAASPDGGRIAFLTEVEGARQIAVVTVEGGAVRHVTGLPQGVGGGPAWSPDGRSIAFTAGPPRRDPARPYRIDRETYRWEGIGNLDDAAQDLYVVEVESGALRRLTDDRCMNTDPRWSPDGRSLCYRVAFPPEKVWDFRPDLHVIDVESGESHLVVGEWGGVSAAEWCADGRRIAFVGASAENYFLAQKDDLWVVDAAGGAPECRTAGVLAGAGCRIQHDLPIYDELAATRIVIRGEHAYVGAQVGGDMVVDRVALAGPESVEHVAEVEGSVYLLDVAPDGTILAQVTSFLDPPELVYGTTRVTHGNDDLVAGLERPDLHRLEVTAPDGVPVEAWALTPPGREGPFPTVLYIHGGPYGAFGSTYMIDFQLLVGAGFAVVFHNFRGSGGYGSEFGGRIVSQWGPAGQLDHHAVVDEAIRLGIADPERLGVCGYSHGGFATCWLAATSDRFRAAVAENPATDWTSKWGTADAPFYIEYELGGAPYEAAEAYRAQSPLTYAPDCRTPILFVLCEGDLRVPPSQAEQYYRIVRRNGVPSEMLRIPNAHHIGSWNGPVAGRLAQNEALLDWFERHLTAS
jgi:dipeptidyl aminopeptidase/acylaminoacyl peptidase